MSLSIPTLRQRRRRRETGAPAGWTATALVVAGLFALPVATVVLTAFTPTGELWQHLAGSVLPRYLVNSLCLAAGVGLGTFVLGTACAWAVTMCAFPGKRLFEWALFLPMAVPAYLLAYTFTGIFDVAGPVQGYLRALTGLAVHDYWFPDIRSLPGAILVMTLVLYPYVYMMARAAFLEQSVCVLEIGRTLGCTPWTAFRRIALPLARPAIATGVALVLMETLGDFGTVQYFAVDTFTTGIYRTWMGMGDRASAAQLAAMLLGAIAVLLAAERLGRGGARFHHTSTRYRPLPQLRLRGGKAALAVAGCAAPVLLGFVLPGVQLAAWAIGDDTMDGASFLTYAGNTLMLAVPTAVLAILFALVLGYGKRLGQGPVGRVATTVASLGYAIPGSVIAVGVLIPLARFDNALDRWMRDSFDLSTGLLLSGTIAALVFAYLVRFMAIAFNSVDSGLAKITPNMDAAARSLGQSPAATLRRVHFPMMGASLATAGLLILVDVIKELPATLIMRPFNFDTLAVKTFELASDERLAEAALPGFAILACGIVPVILLSRTIARARPGAGGAAS